MKLFASSVAGYVILFAAIGASAQIPPVDVPPQASEMPAKSALDEHLAAVFTRALLLSAKDLAQVVVEADKDRQFPPTD